MATRDLPADGARARDIAVAVNQILKGKLNCTGSITLTANATSTTVNTNAALNCASTSHVFLIAESANAAAEAGGTSLYVTPGNGSFIINHANNAQTDRTFGYLVVGG